MGAARDREGWCPWVGAMPPKGHPRDWRWGAERGGEGEQEYGCRVSGIRPDPRETWFRIKGTAGAGGLENSNICIRGEKANTNVLAVGIRGFAGESRQGGQEPVWEARARQGHRGPLPSRVGAVWAWPSRPRAEERSLRELMDGGGVDALPDVPSKMRARWGNLSNKEREPLGAGG